MKYHQTAVETNLLILSNNKPARKSLYEMLCRNGYEVDLASSVEEALTYLEKNPRRIILTDIFKTGTKLLNIIKDSECPSHIIMLISYGDKESAVGCMKMGGCSYLIRPAEDEQIISAIEKASANLPSLLKECSFIKHISKDDDTFYGLVGNGPPMKKIYSLIERISNTKATILLYGESGTGKRVIANAIHQHDESRRNKPFVEVSCGALPREIIESELFGHTKGAFTGAIIDRKGRFELAHGGTILLDDIDSMPLDLQVKLLRVLQQKEFERVGDHNTVKVDVRVVASTNQDLEKAVAGETFRKDLYYRLNVISINVPPLRERKEDLSLLIEHFVKFYSKENHKKIKSISQEVKRILSEYSWPGNIRELENIIERAVILDTDNAIDKDDLPDIILNGVEILVQKPSVTQNEVFKSLKDALKEPEKIYILKILQEVGWNKKRAATKLGVNRTTLYNKLKRYNILSYLDKNK